MLVFVCGWGVFLENTQTQRHTAALSNSAEHISQAVAVKQWKVSDVLYIKQTGKSCMCFCQCSKCVILHSLHLLVCDSCVICGLSPESGFVGTSRWVYVGPSVQIWHDPHPQPMHYLIAHWQAFHHLFIHQMAAKRCCYKLK